jgi:hypothetical protein
MSVVGSRTLVRPPSETRKSVGLAFMLSWGGPHDSPGPLLHAVAAIGVIGRNP